VVATSAVYTTAVLRSRRLSVVVRRWSIHDDRTRALRDVTTPAVRTPAAEWWHVRTVGGRHVGDTCWRRLLTSSTMTAANDEDEQQH